jgi:hypothetical protein
MRTSTKIWIATLALLAFSMVIYDLALRAEYRSGKYKIPFNDYTDLQFKDFDTINVRSASAANVLFEQGPFRVRIGPGAEEFTRISQDKRTLNIEAVFKHGFQNNQNPYVVIISCPKIAELRTSAWYGTNGTSYTDTVVHDEWNMRKVWVQGFKQDSLIIRQDYGSRVFLSNNNIAVLNAAIGLSNGSGSQLNILNTNHFGDVTLNIGNKSTLLINSIPKSKFNCRLADSARLVLTGAAQNILKKQ